MQQSISNFSPYSPIILIQPASNLVTTLTGIPVKKLIVLFCCYLYFGLRNSIFFPPSLPKKNSVCDTDHMVP